MPRKTTQQLKAENAVEMDREFVEKYPAGKFTLQRHYGNGIHWEVRRKTAARSFEGITVYQRHDSNEIKYESSRNNAFGKNASYDNLEACLSAARRLGFPQRLINAFLERYNRDHERLLSSVTRVGTLEDYIGRARYGTWGWPR